MSSAEAMLQEDNSQYENAGRVFPELVKNLSQHTIELDLNALEKAGKWGVARVNIAGKTYQLFPVETV